jgi:hypothetical protein
MSGQAAHQPHPHRLSALFIVFALIHRRILSRETFRHTELSCFPKCVNFLGAFSVLRKATGNFVMPLPMEQLGSHWTDFCEI